LRSAGHYLFNWKIRPRILTYAMWKAYSSPTSNPKARAPNLIVCRKFWFWEYDGKAAWYRIIIARHLGK